MLFLSASYGSFSNRGVPWTPFAAFDVVISAADIGLRFRSRCGPTYKRLLAFSASNVRLMLAVVELVAAYSAALKSFGGTLR
jgi:hypothetical protein